MTTEERLQVLSKIPALDVLSASAKLKFAESLKV